VRDYESRPLHTPRRASPQVDAAARRRQALPHPNLGGICIGGDRHHDDIPASVCADIRVFVRCEQSRQHAGGVLSRRHRVGLTTRGGTRPTGVWRADQRRGRGAFD